MTLGNPSHKNAQSQPQTSLSSAKPTAMVSSRSSPSTPFFSTGEKAMGKDDEALHKYHK